MMTIPRTVNTTSAVIVVSCFSLTAALGFWIQTVIRPRLHRRKQAKDPSSSSYEQLIGRTPMVKLEVLSRHIGRCIFLKMENLNPGGTGKDRAALCMIQHAESLGQLPPQSRLESKGVRQCQHEDVVDRCNLTKGDDTTENDPLDETLDSKAWPASARSLQEAIDVAMKHSRSGGLVIEGTSGSTGISLATLCAARGHACLVVLPDDQSLEKKLILEALGATVRIVPSASISNPNHYVNVARTLTTMAKQQGIAAAFINQFENMANFKVHYDTTGPEIFHSCPELDAFCMSSGTGGTLAGVAKYLKEQKPSVRTVLVDPPGSALFGAIQYGVAYAPQQRERTLKRHRYDTIAEGIGLDRLTSNFRAGMGHIDESIQVSDQEAVDMAHYLLRTEGLWVGSSSAMNVVGAVRTANRLSSGSTVVTVICDSGQRHVTRFWNKKFIRDWGLVWPGGVGELRFPECMMVT